MKIRLFFIRRIPRNSNKNFVIFSEISLDKWRKGWYHNRARVGGICGFFPGTHKRTAMMREIARETR